MDVVICLVLNSFWSGLEKWKSIIFGISLMELVLGQNILDEDSREFCCSPRISSNVGHKRPWSAFICIILGSHTLYSLFVNPEQKAGVLNLFHQSSDKCFIKPSFPSILSYALPSALRFCLRGSFWREAGEGNGFLFWRYSHTCCKFSMSVEGDESKSSSGVIFLGYSDVSCNVRCIFSSKDPDTIYRISKSAQCWSGSISFNNELAINVEKVN